LCKYKKNFRQNSDLWQKTSDFFPTYMKDFASHGKNLQFEKVCLYVFQKPFFLAPVEAGPGS